MKFLSREKLSKTLFIVSISSVILFAINLLLNEREWISLLIIPLFFYSPLFILFVYKTIDNFLCDLNNKKNIAGVLALLFLCSNIKVLILNNDLLFGKHILSNIEYIGAIILPVTAFIMMIALMLFSTYFSIDKISVKIIGIMSSALLCIGSLVWIYILWDFYASVTLCIFFTLINLSCAFSSLLLYQKKEEAVCMAEPAK